jgi:hypothetical protein
MANKIVLKKSSIEGKIPIPSDLDFGEIALNYADGKLYYKNTNGSVALLGGDGAATSLRIYQRGAITQEDATIVFVVGGILQVRVRTSTDPEGIVGVTV